MMKSISKVQSKLAVHTFVFKCFRLLFLFSLYMYANSTQATIIWSGSGLNDNWSNSDNWLSGTTPTDANTVIFNSNDSGNINVVDTDFTIAGLQYIGNSTHTTDFGGAINLQVEGAVIIGNGSGSGGTAIWTNGGMTANEVYFGRSASTGTLEIPSGSTFQLGTATDPVSFLGIAYHDLNSGSGTSTAHLDFTVTDPVFEAYIGDNLQIGLKRFAGSNGQADGSLILGDNSHLHIGTTETPASVTVGYSTAGTGIGLLDATRGDIDMHLTDLNIGRQAGYSGSATGTLRWNQPDPIYATNVYFGRGPSTGILDVPEGGTFLLGTEMDPVSFLGIGYHDLNSGSGTATAHLDFTVTDPVFEAYIGDNLQIGLKRFAGSNGQADGSLILGDNSHLHVGTTETPASVTVGYSTAGTGIGLLDATRGDIDMHLTDLNIGRQAGYGGSATGTLRWDQPDPIYATNVYFGRGPSTGILDVPEGGTFLLGTESDPVSFLGIGYHDLNSGSGTSTAHLDFTVTDPVFEAYTGDNLQIGLKRFAGSNGQADGSLILGDNSYLHVGTSETPASVTVGYSAAGTGIGLLDATRGDIDMHLTDLNIGRQVGYGGSATGTLRWDQPDPIYATNVYFGRGPSTGILDVPEGGTFLLGTETDPVSFLGIGYHDLNSGSGTATAHLDFTVTDPVFEAYIGDNLQIGLKRYGGSSGQADGSLILGDNSYLHVGTTETPASVTVGYSAAGTGIGLLDATRGDIDMHLTDLNVGYQPGYGGTATGTFTTGQKSIVKVNTTNIGNQVDGTATGTFNLAGGLLASQIVNMGENGTFNFTDGRFELGTFNTYGGVGALLQQGGTLAPGFSPGQATINGDFNMYSAGTLEVELYGLTVGSEYDQLVVNGAVDLDNDNLGGGMLDLVLGYDAQIGDSFLLIDNDGTDPVQGHFAGLFEGSLVTAIYQNQTYAFEISYMGHTGNDVVLNTVIIPAPGAIILGGIGLGFVGWLRRRRTI